MVETMFWPWAFWRGYWLESEMYCYGYSLEIERLEVKNQGLDHDFPLGWFWIIVWCHLSAFLLLIQHCLWTCLREAIMCCFGIGMGEDSCGCGRPHHPHSSSQHLGYLSLQWEVHRCPAYDSFFRMPTEASRELICCWFCKTLDIHSYER